MNCSDGKVPRNKTLLFKINHHDSSLGRHVNAASRKSLEIQAQCITKPKIPFGAKICMNISFQLLLYII